MDDTDKTKYIANISHELYKPLNSIIAMTDILLEEYFGDLNEQQVEYLNDIKGSAEHLQSLIARIPDVSAAETDSSSLKEKKHQRGIKKKISELASRLLKGLSNSKVAAYGRKVKPVKEAGSILSSLFKRKKKNF